MHAQGDGHRGEADFNVNTYIVEDNATIRENLISTLEEWTCILPIGFAETEHDAKPCLGEHRNEWQLTIIDLFLKQGSDLGVLPACMQRQQAQKVAALSNYATPDIGKRCAQLGVDAALRQIE